MTGLTLPVAEHSHAAGDCAITGGYVYRGSRFPALAGTYFFGDYCTGHLWGLTHSGASWNMQLLLSTGMTITTFGQDDAGELYVDDYATGSLYLITEARTTAGPVASVVNAASFEPGVPPGSLGFVLGRSLSTVTGAVDAPSAPLPATLNETSVRINGASVPLVSVAHMSGQDQIVFQMPYEIPPGPATLVVQSALGSSDSYQFDVPTTQPGVFTFDGTTAAALHAIGYGVISDASPAAAGEVIVLFATGLGATSNQPPTGTAAPLAPLAITNTLPQVTIGGKDAVVAYSGLAPFFVGLYQLNVVVPQGLSPGPAQVAVSIGGQQSNTALISVQ
jgi:uncharacterized protein (TIGR03437 family)